MTAAQLVLDSVSKAYGDTHAVTNVTLQIDPGELIVLLGPSGCGKTTTLRMIAGFTDPTAGDIRLDDRSIVPLPAHRRDMGIVFQSYALFPHLSVARNVAFGLEMRRWPRQRVSPRVQEMLQLVKLHDLSDRLPRHLSGGQQQRVALARALAIEPRVLLLDEPLSNLDAALRGEMAREIRLLQRDRGITTVMVTHDQAEAMAMADRLVVMKDGGIQQIGTQEDLYQRPASPFVASFIGASNIIYGRLDRDRLHLPGARIDLTRAYQADGEATLALHPECLRLLPPSAHARARGTVDLCTYLGAVVEHAIRLAPDVTLLARGPAFGPDAVERHAPGTEIGVTWSAADERLFTATGQPAKQQQGEQAWTA